MFVLSVVVQWSGTPLEVANHVMYPSVHSTPHHPLTEPYSDIHPRDPKRGDTARVATLAALLGL